MKIISLNTWCGRAGKDNLLDFFSRNKDTDIFCLQEVWEGGHDYAPIWGGDIDTTMITNISKILLDHQVFFRPFYMDWYGLVIFAKKDLKILEEGDIFVHGDRKDTFNEKSENHVRNIQYLKVETLKGMRTIVNFHGLWNGVSKEDTEERIVQSDNIIKFLKNLSEPHILCGDFNLLPENKSLKMLEEFGLDNLIKKFGITSTRSSHYTKPVRFADYTFVSQDIKVNEFKVLPDEVSDHLAMYLNFE